jgi:hypothetical protein
MKQRFRLVFLFLFFILILGIFSPVVLAVDIIDNVTIDTTWNDGDVITKAINVGNSNNPIIITVNGMVTVKGTLTLAGSVTFTGNGTLKFSEEASKYKYGGIYTDKGSYSLTLDGGITIDYTVPGINVSVKGICKQI